MEPHSSTGDPPGTTTEDGKKKRIWRRRGRRGGKNNKKKEKITSTYTTIKIFNLSSSVFDDTELNVLRKGLNFAHKNPPNLFEIFVDLNRCTRNLTLKRYFALPKLPPKMPSVPTNTPSGNNLQDVDITLLDLESLYLEGTCEDIEMEPELLALMEKQITHTDFKSKSSFHPHWAKGKFIPIFYEIVLNEIKKDLPKKATPMEHMNTL